MGGSTPPPPPYPSRYALIAPSAFYSFFPPSDFILFVRHLHFILSVCPRFIQSGYFVTLHIRYGIPYMVKYFPNYAKYLWLSACIFITDLLYHRLDYSVVYTRILNVENDNIVWKWLSTSKMWKIPSVGKHLKMEYHTWELTKMRCQVLAVP